MISSRDGSHREPNQHAAFAEVLLALERFELNVQPCVKPPDNAGTWVSSRALLLPDTDPLASLKALAANQDLLIRNEWKGVDVEELVRAQLAHFADIVGSRIVVHGQKLHLNAAAAQAIGLALHELATNAGKYGALSVDAGRVDVGWQLDGDIFAMNWTERDGPTVSPPERRGFGRTVLEAMAKRTVDGEVELDYAPSGLGWLLTCQAANALEPGRA
jgi:two-component sensor histidine kinase